MSDRCAHEACACSRGPSRAYCSAYCANAEETESLPGEADLEGACSCGHAACEKACEPRRADQEVVTSTGREPSP